MSGVLRGLKLAAQQYEVRCTLCFSLPLSCPLLLCCSAGERPSSGGCVPHGTRLYQVKAETSQAAHAGEKTACPAGACVLAGAACPGALCFLLSGPAPLFAVRRSVEGLRS